MATTLQPPVVANGKFFADGTVRSFRGNTVVCPLDCGSALFAALVASKARLEAMECASAFAFLPTDSYHMTVFQGVNDQERAGENWPSHLAADATLEQATAAFRARLAGASLPETFEMRPVALTQKSGTMLSLVGASAAVDRALWFARGELAGRLGFRRARDLDYGFHVTLSYRLRPLQEEEQAELDHVCAVMSDEIRARVATAPIGRPSFCSFETMHRFDPVLPLWRADDAV